MVKLIKGMKIKVQPAIQDQQVRLTGKNIDDLQEVMQVLREQDYEVPLQFTNMKSQDIVLRYVELKVLISSTPPLLKGEPGDIPKEIAGYSEYFQEVK